MNIFNENLSLWSAIARSNFKDWKTLKIDKENYLNEIVKYFEDRKASLFVFYKGKLVNITKDQTNRSSYYQDLLSNFTSFINPNKITIVPFIIGDGGINSTFGPFFSFQKTINQNSILLPDIDMVANKFYSDTKLIDNIEYDQKLVKACFVGSTTGGGGISLEKVSGNDVKVPRLKSCRFFHTSDLVDFSLPQITQCEDQGVVKFIREHFKTGQQVPWSNQLKYRFIISMDGNGATCSRVSKTLSSNSVLLKYNSDSILFFFKILEPWIHFIPISNDNEVISVIQIEQNNPGYFRDISINANKLTRKYLNPWSIYTYIECLIKELQSAISFSEDDIKNHSLFQYLQEKLAKFDGLLLSGHLSAIGELSAEGNMFGSRNGKNPIELVRFSYSGALNISKNDIQFRATLSNNVTTDILSLGDDIGTRGENLSIIQIEFFFSNDFTSNNIFSCKFEFLDGSTYHLSSSQNNHIIVNSTTNSPIVYLEATISKSASNNK